MGKVIYEAIFLNNEEINNIFLSIRGKTPLANFPENYHVTTEFMPINTHEIWYGEKVDVHIIAYALQEVDIEDGNKTTNEGLKVELFSNNKEFNNYLNSRDLNYHITGSYKELSRYTNNIDFFKGKKLDIHVTGIYGAYYS